MIRNYSSFDTMFRAWDIESEEMCRVDVIFIEDGDVEGIRPDGSLACLYKGEFVGMQSIGAKDKNGNDIFELDVIEWEGFVMVMVYNSTYGGYLPMYDSCVCENLYRNNDDTKIIGTIFDPEHKELYDKVKSKLGLEV